MRSTSPNSLSVIVGVATTDLIYTGAVQSIVGDIFITCTKVFAMKSCFSVSCVFCLIGTLCGSLSAVRRSSSVSSLKSSLGFCMTACVVLVSGLPYK